MAGARSAHCLNSALILELVEKAMPTPKTLDQALDDAFSLSIELESRRASVGDLDVRRLSRAVESAGSGMLTALIKKALVSEMNRDFRAFDSAANALLEKGYGAGGSVFVNLSSTAIFALNPRAAVALAREGARFYPDNAQALGMIARTAWFGGNFMLYKDSVNHLMAMGADLADHNLHHGVIDLEGMLSRAGSNLDEYQGYVDGFYKIIRKHTEGRRNTRLVIDVGAHLHEDGQEKIALQVFADMSEEDLESLDDELMSRECDENQVSDELSSVVTYLVRDFPENRIRQVGI